MSMFRFEHLSEPWIDRCARYLAAIFGDALKGATVIDYAFGRGNWSLAFIRAGASKVIAIDASETNVARFDGYIKQCGVTGIEVVLGNVLEALMPFKADILWLYGIVPCIDDPERFLSLMTNMWRDRDNGVGLVYGYNRFSLRQVIVDLARQSMVFDSYRHFEDEALMFSPAARLRVRDDLTAPRVLWQSKREMEGLVRHAGAAPIRFVESFAQFEGVGNREFEPHHLIFNGGHVPAISSAEESYSVDEDIIRRFGQGAISAGQGERRRQLSIGLANTHFTATSSEGYLAALVADFSYLLYAWKIMEIEPSDEIERAMLELAEASLRNEKNRVPATSLSNSSIAHYLASNSIRI